MTAYYNEFEPYAAEWLRNLIKEGLIAPGDVDDRSITDVAPADLHGYTQCHFFAGIGVWSYALRNAGWPDERPVWTGSPPCQPFSAAGKKGGKSDERHLWPVLFDLIRECRPAIFLGEQVSSKDGLGWFDDVQADMESENYACGALDTCSAGSGAPHIRQRLRIAGIAEEWLVHGECEGLEGQRWHGDDCHQSGRVDQNEAGSVATAGAVSGLADDTILMRNRGAGLRDRKPPEQWGQEPADLSGSLWLADADLPVAEQPTREGARPGETESPGPHSEPDGRSPLLGHNRPTGPTNGFWGDADWLFCRDEKWRPVRPGTFPLVDGAAFKLGSGSALEGKSRTGMLKGYGNAVEAETTRIFIEAVMETLA